MTETLTYSPEFKDIMRKVMGRIILARLMAQGAMACSPHIIESLVEKEMKALDDAAPYLVVELHTVLTEAQERLGADIVRKEMDDMMSGLKKLWAERADDF